MKMRNKWQVSLVLLLVLIAITLGVGSLISHGRYKAEILSDASCLKGLGFALRMFASDYNGCLPMDLGFLQEMGYLENGKIYVCSGAKSPTPPPKDGEDIRNGYCDYLYFGAGQKESDYTPRDALMCTKPGIYGNEDIIVLYGDGHVATYRTVPAAVKRAIAENEKRLQEFNQPVIGFVDVKRHMDDLLFEYVNKDRFYSFRMGHGTLHEASNKAMKVPGREVKFYLSKKSKEMLLTILNVIERDKLFEIKPARERDHGMYSNWDRVIYNTGVHFGEFDMNETPGRDFFLLQYRIHLLLGFLQTDLMKAVKVADMKEVERLLETNANINAQDRNGTTALMLAAKSGHENIVGKLLARKADPAIENWHGITALGWAMQENHQSISGMLRATGVDVNRGNPVLLKAVWNEPGRIPALVNEGMDVDARDGQGRTALMEAVSWNKVETAKMLLALGANVNARDNRGRTPLMHGAAHLESTRLLLKHGAEVNAVADDKDTALLAAAQTQVFPGPGENAGVVKLLLENGADLNARNAYGRTALMNTWFFDVTKVLLEQGADPNDNVGGTTALILHSLHGKGELVRLLLDSGAKPNVRNSEQATALMWACINGHNEIAEMLIKAGAEVNVQDEDGTTAMMESLRYGNAGTVKLLLENGGDMHLRNKGGKTALDLARETLPDLPEGRSYPHLRREEKVREIIQLLESELAKPPLPDLNATSVGPRI
jgi:ankyrin repeat protein